jgi:hypothetical protein
MLNMWSSWVKRNGTTQVMYIAKLKDGSKRANKTFSMILERIFEMVWWRGRKWNHIKKDILEVEVFFSSQNIEFPFIWRDSWSFSFSSSFFFFSISFPSLFLCSVSWGLGGFSWYLRRKITSSKMFFSNGMSWSWLWIYLRWMRIPEWGYARQYS